MGLTNVHSMGFKLQLAVAGHAAVSKQKCERCIRKHGDMADGLWVL